MVGSRNRYTAAATVLGAVAAVAGLGACGGSSSSGNGEAAKAPTQILADAKAATSSAASLHVAGKVTDSSGTTSIDLAIGHGNGGGSIGQDGETFQIVVAASNVYLKADAATWTKAANASAAQLLAGKWIQTTTSNQDFASLAGLVDVSKLVSSLTPDGTLSKGSTTTFMGSSAVPLTDNGGNKGTLYVAATGPAYVLGVTGGTKAGSLTFDHYGSASIPGAPSGALNLDQLEQGGG